MYHTVDWPGGAPKQINYADGSYGHENDGWWVTDPQIGGLLQFTVSRPTPGQVGSAVMQLPDFTWYKTTYLHETNGQLQRREYTDAGGLFAAEPLAYTYDSLGRIDGVDWLGPAESYDLTPLGVPITVNADTNWTYTAADRFGEVPRRDGPSTQERFFWDGQGRIEKLGHWDPDEIYAIHYHYDGAGRLANAERKLPGPSGTTQWNVTLGYDGSSQLVYENRTSWLPDIAPREVHRHGPYHHDTTVGETLSVLPMLRIVDGVEWNWLFVEPDGRAPWVLNEDTSERSFEVLGAYGRPVYASAAGASWHLDGMHGAERDEALGLVHHGVRHARHGDGLWMQPEPLLALGMTNGDLANPLGYGPLYAAGNTNAFTDRSGFRPMMEEVGNPTGVDAIGPVHSNFARAPKGPTLGAWVAEIVGGLLVGDSPDPAGGQSQGPDPGQYTRTERSTR